MLELHLGCHIHIHGHVAASIVARKCLPLGGVSKAHFELAALEKSLLHEWSHSHGKSLRVTPEKMAMANPPKHGPEGEVCNALT